MVRGMPGEVSGPALVNRRFGSVCKMDNQHYGKLFTFIWNIANDVLVFKKVLG